MKVSISHLRKIKSYLADINTCDFDAIDWVLDDDTHYEVPQELKDEFIICGLANKNFIDFLPSDLNATRPIPRLVLKGSHKDSEVIIQGLYQKITGKSWRDSMGHEAVSYSMRIMRDGLPYDDDVYIGTISQKLVLLHSSELEDLT